MPLEVMLCGTCDRTRLLELVENFTLFSEHEAGLVKITGQNHQFLGVNNAIASMLDARKLGHGRGGVLWQTQGSDKSFSMVFFAQKVLRKFNLPSVDRGSFVDGMAQEEKLKQKPATESTRSSAAVS